MPNSPPDNPEAAEPGLAAAAGSGGQPGLTGRPRVVRGLVVVGLVAALGVGAYAFVLELDKSSTAKAMDTFCNSVGNVMQLAYDHAGGLGTLHKMVDKDADAVGGRALSDTRAFELALSRHDTTDAEKYLIQLDELCSSDGSPISTPITTALSPKR